MSPIPRNGRDGEDLPLCIVEDVVVYSLNNKDFFYEIFRQLVEILHYLDNSMLKCNGCQREFPVLIFQPDGRNFCGDCNNNRKKG